MEINWRGALLKLEVQGENSVTAIENRAPNIHDGTAIQLKEKYLSKLINISSSVNGMAVHIYSLKFEAWEFLGIAGQLSRKS